jgi:succinate dehydrogenase / fumarate reductase cytochrome b subunit
MVSMDNIKSKRPLSPHIQIYKPQITSVLSILHRITGFSLSIGLLLFSLWLVGAAYSPDLFESVIWFASSFIGVLFLFGWSVAFYYHLANGIRHLIWDTGRLLEIEDARKSGFAVLGFTFGATLVTWVYLAMELL